MSGKWNLTIEVGSVFDQLFTWKTGPDLNNLVPVDLTGYTAYSQFRQDWDSEEIDVDASTADATIVLGGVEGTIQYAVPRTVTVGLQDKPPGVWDLFVVDSLGAPKRLLHGTVSYAKRSTVVP